MNIQIHSKYNTCTSSCRFFNIFFLFYRPCHHCRIALIICILLNIGDVMIRLHLVLLIIFLNRLICFKILIIYYRHHLCLLCFSNLLLLTIIILLYFYIRVLYSNILAIILVRRSDEQLKLVLVLL